MPDDDTGVARWVAEAKDHDENAARELLRHFYPFVLKLVRAHLPHRTSEEDLAQMIFIKAFQSIDRYSGAAPFRHWLSRIAVNTCLNELKAEKARPELRLADLSPETAAIVDGMSARGVESPERAAAARELVAQLMGRLGAADRLVVQLLHLEERTVDEVRVLTGWSRASIKVKAFRARSKMKNLLAQLTREEMR
jgi:RNA polymerase sigma-70 factor (ECF subfamily)